MSLVALKVLIQMLVYVCILLPWRRLLSKLGFPVHDFRYRNPYNRTCTKCSQHQNYYCWAWNWGKTNDHGWWEIMDHGRPGHNCSDKDAKELPVWKDEDYDRLCR